MYQCIKPWLFKIDPERSHDLALKSLALAHHFALTRFFKKPLSLPKTVMNLSFPNPVGLAAGFDKNADYIDALATLGFGFIEVGTLTPKPQTGNPKPRLFRLVKEESIINRMGFNNKGIEHASRQLEKMSYKGILGINIGKNKDTPNDKAIDDYAMGFRELAKFASYITINISSPNTEKLRELQKADALTDLLMQMKHEQKRYQTSSDKYVPLVIKISPDLTEAEVEEVASVLLRTKIDGLIATNTSLSREHLADSLWKQEAGGSSGACLRERSTEVLRQFKQLVGEALPIIAAGGIMNANDAEEKIAAGASLVQLYSGLVFRGPGLIREVNGRLG